MREKLNTQNEESTSQLVATARELCDRRRYQDALPVICMARERSPNSIRVHMLLASVYENLNELSKARQVLSEAKSLDPADSRIEKATWRLRRIRFQCNGQRGRTSARGGLTSRSSAYERAVRGGSISHAIRLRRLGFLAQAVNHLYVLVENGSNSRAIWLLCDYLIDMGEISEAVDILKDAIETYPLDVELMELALATGVKAEFTERVAAEQFAAAPESLSLYFKVIRYLNAGEFFEKSIQLVALAKERFDSVNNNIRYQEARAFEGLGEYQDAIVLYSNCNYKGGAEGVARCYFKIGEIQKSLSTLRSANSYAKDLLPTLYAAGNIEGAHRSYRLRTTSREISRVFNQDFNPSLLSIRSSRAEMVMLIAEGGPGDEIRFAAVYDEMAFLFQNLVITCDPRLYSIFTRSFPTIEFLPVRRYRREFRHFCKSDRLTVPRSLESCLNDDAMEAGAGAQLVCSVLDTLGEFRSVRDQFHRNPHLIVSTNGNSELESNKTKTGSLQVGIAWRSILDSKSRASHYLTVTDLQALSELEADYWCLQAGVRPSELEELNKYIPIRMPIDIDVKDDFEAQAAFIKKLDVIISPMTTIAEIAGSVGTKTFLLSPDRSTSWRKNLDGTDIWYRSGELIDGEVFNDKSDMIEEVVARIRNLVELGEL